MLKPETIQRKYNEKLSKILTEFEIKLRDSLASDYQGIKRKIKEMAKEEKNRSGIATAYIMHHRTTEFTESIDTEHPIFVKRENG